LNRNIRRFVNATGRLSTNGNTSPPLLNRTTATGVLSSSSRPSQPSPNVVHHRGAYYTILRPTSRRTDVGYSFLLNKIHNACISFVFYDLNAPHGLTDNFFIIFVLGKMSRRSLQRDLRCAVQLSC